MPRRIEQRPPFGRTVPGRGEAAARVLELGHDPRTDDCARQEPNQYGDPFKLRHEYRYRLIQAPFQVNIPAPGQLVSLGIFGTLRRIWVNGGAAVTFGSLTADALATLKARVWFVGQAFRAVYHSQNFTPATDGELSRVLNMAATTGQKMEIELLLTRTAAGVVTITGVGGAVWGNDNSTIYAAGG